MEATETVIGMQTVLFHTVIPPRVAQYLGKTWAWGSPEDTLGFRAEATHAEDGAHDRNPWIDLASSNPA